MKSWASRPFPVSIGLLSALVPGAPPVKPHAAQKPPSKAAAPTKSTFEMTPETFWHTPYATDPWFAAVGDADGDGRADLQALYPRGDCFLDLARTSPLGKPVPSVAPIRGFGRDAVAAVCGPFARPRGEMLGVFADGSVRVAWGMAPAGTAYEHNDVAGQIPAEIMPKGAVRAAVADFDGDGKADVILLDNEGALVLLHNERGVDGAPKFSVRRLRATLPTVRQFAAGPLVAGGRGECVWLDGTGSVFKASIGDDLGTSTLVTKGSPEEHLAVGRFRGATLADVLVGQRLFAGGDPKAGVLMKGVPPLEIAKGDGPWLVGDVDGNGKDDLVRFGRNRGRLGGEDTYVHFSYDPAKESPGYYSSSNDGLPDVWKTGGIKPAGLDLAALGCKVGHRDVIVEIERFENVDFADMKNHMNRAVQYFASIPLTNPDGTRGIALHVIYWEPWSLKEHDRLMGHFDENFPRKAHRGVAHSMFAEVNGPLVAQINGGNGHFNGHWAEFVHEFGHQLDLHHDGYYGSGSGWTSDTGAAIYPSLMSYTYSYGLDGSGDRIGYSDGARASFVLHPQHLSERLPFPMATVHFLGEEPYHFRLQATPDDKSTLIDWNWNGTFGETDVQACVNYTHGADFGPTYTFAHSDTAPAMVAHGDGPKPRPLLVYSQSSQLKVRAWMGKNRDTEGGQWSDEAVDPQAGVTGDPTATYLGAGVSWIAYPTAHGTVLRKVTLDERGRPQLGPVSLISGTEGAQPTIAALHGRLALLLWRTKNFKVGLCILQPNGSGLTKGGERSLDLLSDVPVGAVAGPATKDGDDSLWVGRIESDGVPNGGRTEVVRYVVGPSGGTVVASRSWLAGLYARHRMTLLWRPEPGKLPEGRLYHLSGGIDPGGKVGTNQFITMNVPYPEIGGGWIIHRYRSPGLTSISSPGACFYDGDIVYALRRYDGDPGRNDGVDVAFYGTGATPWPMGDFDDIGHIRDYGLSWSIREVSP